MAALSLSLIRIFLVFVSLTSLVTIIHTKRTIDSHQDLKIGHTLVSSNKRFELGFFNVSSGSKNDSSHYLGIWYKGIKPLTVVWVGNRLRPLRRNTARLAINSDGDLVLIDDDENTICLTRLNRPIRKPSLILLDSGNLVLKDSTNSTNKGIIVWQSFHYPSDTLLPGMKLGWNLKSRTDLVLTSWRTSSDPSFGDFILSIEPPESPQLVLAKNGVAQSRWGPWNGKSFSGTDDMNENPAFRTIYSFNPKKEVYFSFEMTDRSVLARLVVNSTGAVQFLKWKSNSRSWVPMETLNNDRMYYASCGPYTICEANDPASCRCLKGFAARGPHHRQFGCTKGCRRKTPLNCRINSTDDDGFVKFSGLRLPQNFTVWKGLSYEECGDRCLKDCTCMAYSGVDVYQNGTNCVVWLGKLIGIRESARDGDELYIRMAHSELDTIYHGKRKKNVTLISSLLAALTCVAAFWFAAHYRSISKRDEGGAVNAAENTQPSTPVKDDDEQYIQMFDKRIILVATNNFSPENKIGQGGFGPVYKGVLQSGQEIAVKKMSKESTQGLEEFKNEMNLIAQLQHRNLVNLLGCCIDGEERMLVYEYMPNKSLDKFIFDPTKKSLLPWPMRFSILKGIAKGLDYLHSGSRLRVVHRDLKASNILLDDEMNPRISDFGLARNFENVKEVNTKSVIGTHGYMSPEYVTEGNYSMKSDVFSFGVLLLEFISGERNWGFHHPDHDFNLLGHAWKLWNEGKELKITDHALDESFVDIEVSRCIQIGLLCVQHNAEERPTMSQVVSMLENEDLRITEPQEPGFYSRMTPAPAGCATPMEWEQDSVNGLTITELTGRTI